MVTLYFSIPKIFAKEMLKTIAISLHSLSFKVTISNLTPNTKYVYHCGGKLGWSPEFWFVTTTNETNAPIHVAIFGDMGNENAQSLARLQEDTQRRWV